MNTKQKFSKVKQSLVSQGRTSQVIDSQTYNQFTSAPPTTNHQMPISSNPKLTQTQVIHPHIFQQNNYQHNNQFQDPSHSFTPIHQSHIQSHINQPTPGTVIYKTKYESPPLIQSTIPYKNPNQSIFTKNNQNTIDPTYQTNSLFNPRQSTMNKGAIRSALKFDYQLGGIKIKKTIIQKPAMNVFSCMDNTNYQRQFEVTPKIMRK